MEFRLYCELKINEKATGKLVKILTGVYYGDEEDLKTILREGSFEPINEEIEDTFRELVKDQFDPGKYIYHLNVTYLDDDFEDEDEDDGE